MLTLSEAKAILKGLECSCAACEGVIVWEALLPDQKRLYLEARDVVRKHEHSQTPTEPYHRGGSTSSSEGS